MRLSGSGDTSPSLPMAAEFPRGDAGCPSTSRRSQRRWRASSTPNCERPLGELGMVGGIRVKRRSVEVQVLLPVAHYPQVDELVAPGAWGGGRGLGAGEVAVDPVVMDEQSRAGLRFPAPGGPGEPAGGPAGHGHSDGLRRGPRSRGGPAQPVHATPLQNPGARDRIGQGRCRQILGDGQFRGGAGPDGPRHRDPRRRRLRVLRAGDARGRPPIRSSSGTWSCHRRPTVCAACRWGSSSPTRRR